MPNVLPNSTAPAPGVPVAPVPADTTPRALRFGLVATVWVAGAFCMLVAATMLYFHFTATTNDPWKSPQLLALKERLESEPKNGPLKEQIRTLDAEFRRKFRHRLGLDASGGWLLLGGALVMVVAARTVGNLNRKFQLSPRKPAEAEAGIRLAAWSRWSVLWTGAVLAATLILIGVTSRTNLPELPNGVPAPAAGAIEARGSALAEPVSLAEFRANWPRFRGWDGGGVSTDTNVPLTWDAKTGAGIAWKTPVLAPGHNSPIVWSNRVFISGATATNREVFAYDAADGRLVWRRSIEKLPGPPAAAQEVPDETGYAASTTATDGRFVYALFVNGDVAAVSFDGAVAWSKALGPLNNPYGHATSLAIWPGKLIVQLDQGTGSGANSKLVALDAQTGRKLWERGRLVSATWATPIILEAAGQTQIITLGEPWVISYSMADGSELWRTGPLEGELVPSPIFADGQVVIASPSSKLLVVRPDGAGDVTKQTAVWKTDDNTPDIPSPVGNARLVVTANSAGDLTGFDAKDGTKLWTHDLQMEVQASPVMVGNRLFVMGSGGVAVVAEVGRSFREIARSELADKFLASPAFANGRMFLRGETNLYCVGPSGGAMPKEP